MKRFFVIFLIALAASLGTGTIANAASLKVLLSPNKVGPGDILQVMVKNADGPVEGSFDNRAIHFNFIQGAYKAIIGIDLVKEPGKYPLVLTSKGRTIHRIIRVSKKFYPLQRLTLPEDKVVLSPENEARVEQEQKKLSRIWPVDSMRLWDGGFSDPLPGKEITTLFGMRRIINNIPKNSHTGVDLSAEEGEPVRAPNSGVVVLAEEQFYSGNSVVLDHGQGIYTMFFHLSKINVRNGQAVMKGDIIGLVGATGRVTGSCLHWGARVQGARVDPLELIHLKLE